MANIYRSASKVIIWLGSAADKSEIALEAFAFLSSQINIDWTTRTINPADSMDTMYELLNYEKKLPFDDETWASLNSLLNRTWFCRLWVWQEVFLGRKCAYVTCGYTSVPWECLRKALFLIYRKPKPLDLLGFGEAISRARHISDLDEQPSLQEILESTRYAKCSDERDRIYGVLNLVAESERLGIKADYSKRTAEVYRELMLRKSINYADLSLLKSCELGSATSEMPSWVPDWAQIRQCRDIGFVRACLRVSSPARYTNGGPLTVLASRAGVIIKTEDAYGYDYTVSDLVEQTSIYEPSYSALRRLLRIIHEKFSVDFEQQQELICRTLCCNEFADNLEPRGTNLLDLQQTKKQLYEIFNSTEESSRKIIAASFQLLEVFRGYARGRALIFTKEGHIGLAPRVTQMKDIIVVVLGCQTPIVLRREQNGHYLVVGECYVHQMIAGDTLLGPLPSNWEHFYRYQEQTEKFWDAFLDHERESWQIEDPRLGPLPDAWEKVEHPNQHVFDIFRHKFEDYETDRDPRMSPESLRARGVRLEEFNLI